MKYILSVCLLLLSYISIAGSVNITWGGYNAPSRVFFSQDGDIIKIQNNKSLTQEVKNIDNTNQPITSVENMYAGNSNNNIDNMNINNIDKSNRFEYIVGGCIPRDDDKEWSCVNDFQVSIYEISNAEYRQFAPSHNSGRGFNADYQPVVNVSFEDVIEYINWLNANNSNQKYRLPTNDEWLYVALAGNTEIVAKNCSSANIENCNTSTIAVGSYPPNNWQLYDTLGNAFEFTQSKMLAGGSFVTKNKQYQGKANDVGFRLVLETSN